MKYHLMTAALTLLACSSPVQADPLNEFEALVSACKSSIAGRPSIKVRYNERSQTWVKLLFGPAVVTYDVVKTNSLVSPFTAFVVVTETISMKQDKDESVLRAAPIAIDEAGAFPLKAATRINYAYQAGAWEATDAMRTSFSWMPSMRDFEYKGSVFRHPKEALPKALSTLDACLPKQA